MPEEKNSQQAEQPKELDAAKFIAERNAADAARKGGKDVPRETSTQNVPRETLTTENKPAEGEQDHEKRSSRSARRRENRLNQQLGEERAQRAALEERLKRLESGQTAKPAEMVSEDKTPGPDGKPLRAAYPVGEAGNDQYYEAIAEWKAEQKLNERDQIVSLKEQIEQADAKAQKDKEAIPNWDELAKKAETLELDHAKHPSLLYMLRTSPVQAPLLAYLAENEEEFDDWMDMKDGNGFIVEFHRLEGSAKAWYRSIIKSKEATGAEQKPKGEAKERTHPAEAQAGRNPEVKLPKPSSEVSAKSGSAPPSEPAIGSPEWMRKRNEEQKSRGW